MFRCSSRHCQIESCLCIADIDECQLNTALCDSDCVNTVGSYNCGCTDGYELAVDGASCQGLYVGTLRIIPFLILLHVYPRVDGMFSSEVAFRIFK